MPRRPKPNDSARRRPWLPLALLIGLLVYSLGFYAGKYGIPPRHYAAGDTGKPVDLTTFFEAKKLIEERYPGQADPKAMVTGATKGLVEGVGDPYSAFLTSDEVKELESSLHGTVEGIGVEIGLRDEQVTVISPIDGSPAERAGVKTGDQITVVDGQPTVGLTVDEVADKVRGPKGTEVTIEIRRPGEAAPRTIKLTRAEITAPAAKLEYRDNVAVLTLSRFDNDTKQELDALVADIQAKRPRGVVLDLRGNPGGYLDGAIDVASIFLKQGVVVKEQLKGSTEERSVSNDGRLADLPLVVLVDQGSASASEIVAGALRDDRGVPLVGEKTYGKGSVQELVELEGDNVLKLTIAEWLTPKGVSISKNGLEPDVKVGSDNPEAQLQAAIGRV